MAHGDALIFLTNIVWIFFLFIFIYLSFVVFFLPSFYKKFRVRVLVRSLVKLISVVSMRNILVSLTFFLDVFRGFNLQILGFVRFLLFYFNVRRTNTLSFFVFNGAASSSSKAYSLNKSLFISVLTDGSFSFTKFKKISQK